MGLYTLPTHLRHRVFEHASRQDVAALLRTTKGTDDALYLYHLLERRIAAWAAASVLCGWGRLTFRRQAVSSSSDDPRSFWVPIDQASEQFMPLRPVPDSVAALNLGRTKTCEAYRQNVARMKRMYYRDPGARLNLNWYEAIPLRRRQRVALTRAKVLNQWPTTSQSSLACGVFGTAPVLLCISQTGGEWRQFTRGLKARGVRLAPAMQRIQEHAFVGAQVADDAPWRERYKTGFPGWEQFFGQVGPPGSGTRALELFCCAMGGDEPMKRMKMWSRVALARGECGNYARATYANVVGIVFCSSSFNAHFEANSFARDFLESLEIVLGEERTRLLPIAWLVDPEKDARVPQGEFQWCREGHRSHLLGTNMTRFFFRGGDSNMTEMLGWLHATRLQLLALDSMGSMGDKCRCSVARSVARSWSEGDATCGCKEQGEFVKVKSANVAMPMCCVC